MAAAIRTILIADLVMSLDNVLAVAAAAKGNLPLLVLGLLVSIPLIIFGATLLTKVMERFPIIITIGAALLGFLAGEMLLTDPGCDGPVWRHQRARGHCWRHCGRRAGGGSWHLPDQTAEKAPSA
jgi:predicted tellurium resistance membrane protein TerC